MILKKHNNITDSYDTFYVSNCTKVVSQIYRDELENCRKEIQSMLNEFIGCTNDELTCYFIKLKAQQIIDTYIYKNKIPDFITYNDFNIEVNYKQI